MATMVQIGDWSCYADSPYGVTAPIPANGIVEQLFQDAVALGLSRVRLQLSAILIETASGVYSWANLDNAVWLANKYGLRMTFPLRDFGAGNHAVNSSWATTNTPCNPSGPTHYIGTLTNYLNFAVAVCQRYSGDGNTNNVKAPDGSGRRLQLDCIEVGNEEFDVYPGDDTNCRNPMRCVQYTREIVAAMRAPVTATHSASGSALAHGGGGWTPRVSSSQNGEQFLARIGLFGMCWQNQTHIKHSVTTYYNPPTDATYNPGGDHSSIVGFNANWNIQLLDYLNFHNYQNPPQNASGNYGIDQELQDIRSTMNSFGDTTTPIWCTEFGATGPAGGVPAAAQSAYYAANNDGTGAGALSILRDGGAQHCDLFTMSYSNPTAPPPYIGDSKSIACKTTSGTYVRFQAWSTIRQFIAANPTWPFGFSGGGGGGGGSGGGDGSLVGAFANAGSSSTINLTTEGTGDWAHWGYSSGTTFDHKSSGGTQISNFTAPGNGIAVQQPAALITSVWSDGAPDSSATTATGSKITPPSVVGGGGGGTPHVMVVAMENHGYEIVGNSSYPHFNALWNTYGQATKFYGIDHPSMCNYLGIAGGQMYGVNNTSNPDSYDPSKNPLSGNTFVSNLDAAQINWRHYAENLPSAGYLGGDKSGYTQHHDPWVYFKYFRTATSSYQTSHLVSLNGSPSFTNLITDLNGASPPPFIFIQPNNNDNGHNNDTGWDPWLNNFVPAVQGTAWYTANSGIIILWWDEAQDSDTGGIGDANPGGGHIACLVISAANNGIAPYTGNINHYGLLRSLEKLYGLPFINNDGHTVNGDMSSLLTVSGGGGGGGASATSNLGNGFQFTVPADTNSRTLKIYVDADRGTGTFAAALSDASAPDYYDSSLSNASSQVAGVYSLTYAAASSGQTLKVSYTLSDGVTKGTIKSQDTFTRSNQTNLGSSSGPPSETYQLVQEGGRTAWSISSNQAKLTSANAGDVGIALLGSSTLQDCEAVGIVNLASSLTDSGGLVLRATTNAAAYYRASLTGSTIVLAYVTAGTSTVLSSQPASLKTNTNYWLRFRCCKSSLYAKYWPNDGSTEPSTWNIFQTDTTLSAAGKVGMRGVISAANDLLLFDALSVIDLSATGDPSSVSLYAADIPTLITTTSGVLSASASTPVGTINLTTEGTGDWAHWGYSSGTSFDHKSNVTQQISNFTSVGSGTYTQDTAALLAYTWTDGTPTASATASTTGSVVQTVGNGFSFTVPADTTARTLNVYVEAKKAQGKLTATLSDGSASAYTDTSLNDNGTGTVQKYALTYNAASASQTLTVQWTMLTDNGVGSSTTTDGADTFTRSNTSANSSVATGWGTASDGTDTYTAAGVTGSPTYQISSNTGKITAAGTAITITYLGTGTQSNLEGLVRWQQSNVACSSALILRATATNTYYRFNAFGGNTLQVSKVVSGTVTNFTATTISYSAATLYWMRARINGSSLYIKHWADGSSEPALWTWTGADSAITGAGQYGLRTRIDAAAETVQYDSLTFTSIPSGGTPGSLFLQGATLIGSAPGGSGGGGPPPPNVTPLVVNAATVLSTPWLGCGIQWDAYNARGAVTSAGTTSYACRAFGGTVSYLPLNRAGTTISAGRAFGSAVTVAPLGLTTGQRALLNTRMGLLSPPLLRTAAANVSWWCPGGIVGTYDFTNAYMQEWYTVFDQAQSIGAQVIVAVNSPAPFSLLSSGWCTAFADLIQYLLFTAGYTNVAYVSGLSEPDTNRATYSNYKNTIEPNLVTALTNNNLLSVVRLIGPDTTATNDSWLTLAATDLAGTLSGYARHAFPRGGTDISSDKQEMTGASLLSGISAADNTNKPVMQTQMADGYLAPGTAVTQYQYGVEMADYAVQLARAGMAALLAYDLDDAMHETQWGFWDSANDPTIRPWFFPWSLLTQLIGPGSILYAPVQPTTNDVRILAALSSQNLWTFVLINRRSTAQTFQVSVPFVPVATTNLAQYSYSQAVPLVVDGNGFPSASGSLSVVLARGFTVTMDANSVLILTQQTATQTTVIAVKRPPLQKRR